MSRIALVTGATRGIGKSILVALINDGFIVVGTSTNEQNAERVTQTIKELNGTGFGHSLNINDIEEQTILLDKINNTYGSYPDTLINNAGIKSDQLALRMKLRTLMM